MSVLDLEQQDLWDGFIQKKVPFSTNDFMERQLRTVDRMVYDFTTRRFGNEEGLDSANRLDSLVEKTDWLLNRVNVIEQNNQTLQDQIHSLQHDNETLHQNVDGLKRVNETLNSHHIDLLRMRRVVLNAESEIRTQTSVRNTRNAFVHGGNVELDIELIQESDGDQACKWQATFQRIYGLDFTRFHDEILRAPIEIIRTANMAATIRIATPWSFHEEAEHYTDLCDSLLKQWQLSVDEGNGASFQIGKAGYDRLHAWYRRIAARSS